MTVSSGFFNSINHDRLYDAEQVSSIFDGIIEDGVYESIGEAFMVSSYAEGNDTVIVGTGRAWFDHTWTLNDAQFSITLSPPNTLLGRIDTIVIDVDRRDSTRANSIKCIEGEYSDSPVAPTLLNEELHKQYPIANITINAGVSAPISNSRIEYLVGTEKCPLVTGPLEALNITNYFQQMESEFEIWFEGVKDILDENVAMDLQNQINELKKNQTVSDNGAIGDFTILMTTAMIEAMKTRGDNLHFSSKSIAQKPYNSIKTFTDIGEMGMTLYRHVSNYSKSFPYNQSFFLPDGKLVRVGVAPYCENYGINDYYLGTDGGVFFVDIITPEGVVTSYYSDFVTFYEDLSIPNSDGVGHEWVGGLRPAVIMFNGMMILSYDYPVKIVCSMNIRSNYEQYRNSSPETGVFYGFGVGSCLITITEENLVTISNPGFVYKRYSEIDNPKHYSDYDTGYVIWNTHAFETPNKELIFANSAYDHVDGPDGQPPVVPSQYTEDVANSVIYKVDSAGVLTSTDLIKLWQWIRPSPRDGVNTLEWKDTDDYYYNAYCSTQDGFIYLDFATDLNVKSRDHFVKINPENLEYSYYIGSFPGDVYYPEIECEAQYYSNKIVKNRTWTNYRTYSESDVYTYDPLILFSSNMSTISSAILCKLFDISNTLILGAINTGENCRGIFAGKNGIGFYGENVVKSLSNANKINLDRLARNSRRTIETETSVTLLFDDATLEIPKEKDIVSASSSGSPASGTSNLYIFKIWYDTEG